MRLNQQTLERMARLLKEIHELNEVMAQSIKNGSWFDRCEKEAGNPTELDTDNSVCAILSFLLITAEDFKFAEI